MDRKSRAIDWDAEAVAMSRHVGTHMFSAHRGAMAGMKEHPPLMAFLQDSRLIGILARGGNDEAADALTRSR
jgi:hypothetical protein